MKKKFITTASLLVSLMFMSPSTALGASDKLSHGSPQQADMDKETLSGIDTLVEEAIKNDVTPGAVVLVAKDGRIVFENAYGYAQRYDMGEELKNPKKMTNQTLFDLASVTKVMGTTQGIMKLVSDGKLDVNETVATYIPEFGQNGKEDVTIADLLTHTSGLTPWEPTYLYASNTSEAKDYLYDLPLEYETGTDRRYSDFSFMVLGYVIEAVTNETLDEFLEGEIYQPLKMNNTFFNASAKTNRPIAATSWGNPYEYKMVDDPNFGYYVEDDPDMFDGWRDYTLVGEVNDGNSYYSHQGVAGHAGVFSTARDLAILGQTMLNGGTYGNTSLYSSEVVDQFTSEQRYGQGYGWELNKSWYMGYSHPEEAFGHTGFTGTQVVFDPVNDIQIIVLANKQNNGQLPSGSYRSTGTLSRNIADTVYESLEQ
ncbi:CubicO group peptidase, beta-lactamase class C family [Alkalibacterium putridalgicola]|uniref:CubicO group peptidase, beta-lactamase class C family n=1 Tax=Alkalibacterium putridalgicola TaxID=426703 RepID=A0A1H7V2G9_9LACT|nr:serine hydrolase [Alkalibacterium putridalgicola]GEK89686.1 UPF0214 protein YbbE [Alkalibacterium putridalgicola]SEM03035.1 CubicO group peptidase, beta-lactamase class C family [Alkalibacterium putridalgicola]